LIFAVVCLLAVVFVYRYVPETKDRNFEQIDTDLQGRAYGAGPKGATA
jgi:MFS transporter, SP family, galactose:H+ symporter